jgi:hypothetical protein
MIQSFSASVSDSNQAPTIGFFRKPRKVLRIYVEVLEAFNAAGSDTLVIGHADDDDAYATSIDVSTTGVKTATLGAGVNYDATPRAVIAKYAAGSGAPTTGSVMILVEYAELPRQP